MFRFSDERICEKFIANNDATEIAGKDIQIELKKKTALPQTIEMTTKDTDLSYGWLENRKLIFYPFSTT